MLLSLALIRLLTLLQVQSKNFLNAEESRKHYFAFEYQPVHGPSSTRYNFFVLQSPSDQSQTQVFNNTNSPQDQSVPDIQASSSHFNCLHLLDSLDLTSNSIVLETSSLVSSKLLYAQCSPPVPEILAYFLIDSSINLQNNKELQNSIILFITDKSLNYSKVRRGQENIESLNSLILSLSGCVPCAINQFQSLDLLSYDELTVVYQMLLSYNEVLVGSKNFYKLNYACQMNPSMKAATRLLNTIKFLHKKSLCDDFVNSFCETYDTLIKNSVCSIQLKELTATILEFSNACYSTYFYYEFDPFDYVYDEFFHYYGIILSAVNMLIYQFKQANEVDFSYNTAFGTSGSQIKLYFNIYDCDYYNKNLYLKTCGSCSQYIFEVKAVFIKYNGYGDYFFRFIYDDSSYYIYNWCKSYFKEYVYTRTCTSNSAHKVGLNICKQNDVNLNIKFYQAAPNYYLLASPLLTVSLDAYIFYYYYVKNLNCQTSLTDNTCSTCKSGYTLSSDKRCYQSVENCAKYYDPSSKCSSCNSGYRLTDTYTCEKCSENCEKCTNLNCVRCKDGYKITADNTCSLCKENCSKCSLTLCLSCIDGYTLHANNTCIKCETGCSICSNLYKCTVCTDGYYLNSFDTNNIYCVKCNDKCLSCSEDYCYGCESLYKINPSSLDHCLYCPHSNCAECDENGFCSLCESQYALNSDKNCVYRGNDGCRLINNNNDCIACRSGYSESAGLCSSCVVCTVCNNILCKTCNEAMNCLSCNYGYYLDQSTSNCLPCISPCHTCNLSGNNCLTCLSNLCLSTTEPFTCNKHEDCDKCLTDKKCRTCKYTMMIPSDEGCICTDGFFKGSSNSCIKCKEECQTCIDNTSCLSCLSLNSSYSQTQGCRCDKGFFQVKEMTNSDACMPCKDTCKECENANDCLTCLASNSKYTQSLGCTCDVGYFQAKEMNNTDACVVCGDICKECEVDNVCSICTALNSTFFNNSGCVCDQGFYQAKEMTYSDACQPCNSTCKECESENVCKTCKALNSNFLAGTGCVCNEGYYKAQEMSEFDACLLCDSKCKECVEAGSCLVCTASNSTFIPSTGCECNQGFYQEKEMNHSDACMPCDSICKECKEESICSVCAALNSTFISNIGCVCDEGFYKVKEMNYFDACQPCNNACKECKEEMVCSICKALNSTYIPNLGCVCEEGFYQLKEMNHTDACRPCNSICKDCKSEDECLTCTAFNSTFITGLGCVCNEGFFQGNLMDMSNACQPCNNVCKECTEENICSICTALNSTFIPGKGCGCDEGFFQLKEMNNTDACKPCNSNCIKCENADECLICKALNSTYFGGLGCICNDGFYQNKEMSQIDACQPCNSACKECTEENLCSTCTALNSTFIPNIGCECNEGFFKLKEMNNSDACKPCNSTCKDCVSENECLTCKALNSTFFTDCVCDVGFYQSKEMSHFDACQPCNNTCKECKEENVCDICTALNSSFIPNIGCQCDEGFFKLKEMNNSDACKPCNSTCKDCISENECLTCKALNSTFFTDCVCDEGFYQAKGMSHINACQPCNSACKECKEENVCSTCTALNSTFIPNIGCQCDEGFFKLKEMNNSDACKPCNSTCKDCISENECLTCKALNSTFFTDCVCDAGFYQAKEMSHFDSCQPCNNTCKECKEENVCDICTALNSSFIPNIGCKCNEEFFKFREMNYSDACLPCNETCKLCENSNKCLTCKALNSTYFEGLGCICDEGFYKVKEMSNLDACQPCNDTCKECREENICDICTALNSTFIPNIGCQCEEGFFKLKEMNNSDACKPCNSTCKDCVSENECLTCKALNSTFFTDCVCDAGFYKAKEMSQLDACQPCNTTCKECKEDNVCSTCTALNSTFTYSLGCLCDKGFYQVKEMNNSDACKPCNSTCEQCKNENECLYCKALNSSYSIEFGCVCDEGFYQVTEMNNFNACSACNNTCKECKEENVCSVCMAINSTFYTSKGCVCDEGFYQQKEMNNSDACNPCNTTCKECLKEDICLLCTALNSTYTNYSGCVCDEGFYQSKEMNNSDACHPCNNTCKSCKEENFCVICTALNSTFTNESGCLCNEGFYQAKEMNNSDACLPCSGACVNCRTENECLVCLALNSTYFEDFGCVCDEGFYQVKEMNNSDACMPCNSTCKSCTNENECLICTALNSTYNKNFSRCECDEGFYQINDMNYTNACYPCNDTCKECVEESSCLVCVALNSTFRSGYGCECDEGFYQLKNMNYTDACNNCNSTCKECKEENVCSICTALNSTFIPDIGCFCDKGFYQTTEMNNTDSCRPCNSTCKECINETTCTLCTALNSTYKNDSGCVCNEGFYQSKEMTISDACLPCNSICKNCENNNTCLECIALNSTYNPDIGCVCDEGFYKIKEMNYSDACFFCDDTCKKCENNNGCLECVALNSTYVPGLGCKCDDGFYQAKDMTDPDACKPCSKTCEKCKTEEECLVCTAFNSYYNSLLGCVCNPGFYQELEMSYTEACKPCDKTCKECKDSIVCSKCTALHSNYVQNTGCVCNEGFYQHKSMDNNDACFACAENCKSCENEFICLVCKENYFLIDKICFQCGSLIPSTILTTVFKESFIDLELILNDDAYSLNCLDLFGINNNDAGKFGENPKCIVKSKNKLLIHLGIGSTLTNETIEMNNFFLNNPNDNCRIKTQVQYSSPLPIPTAIIFGPSKILAKTEPLEIDAILSNSGYEGPLNYEWNISSNFSDIEDYAYSTNSSITIPKNRIKKGTIEVMLKVTNKFGVSDTDIKEILCLENNLIIEFNYISNYSCKINQQCEFFIDKITPFSDGDTFEYEWEVNHNKNLQIIKNEDINKASIIIKPNSFKQGTIGYTVTVKNQDDVTGSGQIFVDIITEKPVIMLDRAIGSISTKSDFNISASQSIDPNLNCSTKESKDCLTFEWICYKDQKECDFEYEKNNEFLSIPKSIVKSKKFDSFVLKVTSADGVVSRISLRFDIQDINYVPIVQIREYFTKSARSRITLSEDFVAEALFHDGDEESKYLKYWVLSTEENILSYSSVVSVSQDYLEAGKEYKLTFNLIVDDVILKYFYDFTVNNPPTPGEIIVDPTTGYPLIDKFTIISTGWEDPDEDYPLLYAFGYFSDIKQLSLISKQANTVFSTFLTYIGESMHVYVLVYDSLGDYTELAKSITVIIPKNTDNLLDKMKEELSTEMTQNIPAIISGIATGILNFEFYVKGEFSSSEKVDNLQEAFDVSYKYLDIYVNKSQSSKELVSQISLILAELTFNPNLKSSGNAEIAVKTIESLLDKSENLGIFKDQSEAFYKVLENSFNYSASLIRNDTDILNVLTTGYENINRARIKNMFYNQSESIESNNANTLLYGMESYVLESSKFSLNNASVTFPEQISNTNLKGDEKIVLSLTYIPLEKSENFTQNLMIITVFDLETYDQRSIQSNSTISIVIPFDQENHQSQTYNCLFFNYTAEKWDDSGCFVSDYNNYSITCECSHLSTFTVGIFEVSFEFKGEFTPKRDFSFLSLEAIGFYICLFLYLAYFILAYFCYLKDNKLLELVENNIIKAEKSRNTSSPERTPIQNHIFLDDINVNNEVQVNNERINKALEENKDKVNEEKKLKVTEEKEKEKVITELKNEENKSNDSIEGQLINDEETVLNNSLINLEFKEKNEENTDKPINENPVNTNDKQTVLKGTEAFSEYFKRLNFYKYTDPNHCRVYRCTSSFLKLILIIFCITSFLNTKQSYENFNDTLKNFTSINPAYFLLTFSIGAFVHITSNFILKEKDLNSTDINTIEDFDKFRKSNKRRVIIGVIIFNLLAILFCVGIALMVQNFDSGVNGILVLNITINLISELFLFPLVRIGILSYFFCPLYSQLKEYDPDKNKRDQQEVRDCN